MNGEKNKNKLYQIQPNIKTKSCTTTLATKDFKKLVRLKIGHCNFSHKYLIEKTSPPLCDCGEQNIVEHIFNNTKNSENFRKQYKI